MARRSKRPPLDDASTRPVSWNWDQLAKTLEKADPKELDELLIWLRTAATPRELKVILGGPEGPSPSLVSLALKRALLRHSAPRKRSFLARLRVELPADAERMFNVMGSLLPPRIANEELGDAMEQIHRMYVLGCPRWQLTLRMWSAIFWAVFHTVTDTLSRVLNRA